MEKRTPHYKLEAIKAEVAVRGVRCFTRSAAQSVATMGLSTDQSLAVIAGLTHAMFQKSMTTHMDHKAWQDVYKTRTPAGTAYVKFTLADGWQVVVSFKPFTS